MNVFKQTCAIAALSLSILTVFSPALCAQEAVSSSAVPGASATATPNAQDAFLQLTSSSRKPIPVLWKIAVVLAVAIAASVALWILIRVWGSANLFDRQYRFPAAATVALRLGANRSGGHSATIKFGNRAGPNGDV
jgi:hypothetical protein